VATPLAGFMHVLCFDRSLILFLFVAQIDSIDRLTDDGPLRLLSERNVQDAAGRSVADSAFQTPRLLSTGTDL